MQNQGRAPVTPHGSATVAAMGQHKEKCEFGKTELAFLAHCKDHIEETELGASLFEIAQSLFALERTFILGAMALNKIKSEEQRAN